MGLVGMDYDMSEPGQDSNEEGEVIEHQIEDEKMCHTVCKPESM